MVRAVSTEGTILHVKVPSEIMKALDTYIKSRDDPDVTRSVAVRTLLREILAHKKHY